jgi:flavin reductase (DIM6/NTAB) family NADH-FMN oxidoreductase RutF
MLENLRNVNPRDLQGNIFELIGDKWMLVTAVKQDGALNTMTASWGGMGIMWGKPVASCVIRPVRYTYEFVEQADYFTLSFFPEEYRKALNILGTKSGRDGDKIKESGLKPFEISFTDNTKQAVIVFEEADIILMCKKIYYQDIDPANFIDKDLDKNYPNKDDHRMYFGEIVQAFINK